MSKPNWTVGAKRLRLANASERSAEQHETARPDRVADQVIVHTIEGDRALRLRAPERERKYAHRRRRSHQTKSLPAASIGERNDGISIECRGPYHAIVRLDCGHHELSDTSKEESFDPLSDDGRELRAIVEPR